MAPVRPSGLPTAPGSGPDRNCLVAGGGDQPGCLRCVILSQVRDDDLATLGAKAHRPLPEPRR